MNDTSFSPTPNSAAKKGFFSFFANLFKKKKKQDWLENSAGQNVAKPKNLTPLDPGNPWIT